MPKSSQELCVCVNLKIFIHRRIKKFELNQKEISDIGTRKTPPISFAQAGLMCEALNPYSAGDAAGYLLKDLDLGQGAFALEIKGGSMPPDFQEGDRIIIDPSIDPMPGDFVVAKNGHEEATFKKYRPRGKFDENGNAVFDLLPSNPDYSPMHSDKVPLRIIGTMVEHRRYRKNSFSYLML